MRKIEIGEKFNNFIVMKQIKSKNNRKMWLCKCACGNEHPVSGTYLINGQTKSCGCVNKNIGSNKSKNILGERFGKLVVIKQMESKMMGNGKQRMWLCKCDCGGEKVCPTAKLVNGTYKDCGCFYKSSASNHHNWKGYGEISLSLWNSIKKGAESRGFNFYIDIEYVWDLYVKQNKKCAYSGIDIYFSSNLNHNRGNASLDRIDSSKGYEKGNVQWIHKDINRMKNDFTESIFLLYCKKITENKITTGE